MRPKVFVIEPKQPDGVVTKDLADRDVVQSSEVLGRDRLRMRPSGVGVWVVRLEREIVDPDPVQPFHCGSIVEDARVDVVGVIAAGLAYAVGVLLNQMLNHIAP